MNCVCGQEIQCSGATPWLSATMDSDGKVIRGTCLHGIEFDFEELRIDDLVEILKDSPSMTWTGCKGKVKYKSGSGEVGVEIITDAYGPVTVWIKPENLKKVS